jgi:hypothetical protein
MENPSTPLPQWRNLSSKPENSDAASIHLENITPTEQEGTIVAEQTLAAQTKIAEKLNEKQQTTNSDVHIENIIIPGREIILR